MFAVVVVAGCFFPKDLPGFMIPVIAILCIGMVVVAQVLFAGRVRMRTHAEIVAERLQMEQAGLLVSESFRAIRAFEVDEFEDGGAISSWNSKTALSSF